MEAPSRAGGFFCSGLLNSIICPLRIVLFGHIEQHYSVTSDSTIQSHRTALFGWPVRIIGADPPAVSIEMRDIGSKNSSARF